MNPRTAMLLAPHASHLQSLMAVSPPHVVLAVAGAVLAVLAVLAFWAVCRPGPGWFR